MHAQVRFRFACVVSAILVIGITWHQGIYTAQRTVLLDTLELELKCRSNIHFDVSRWNTTLLVVQVNYGHYEMLDDYISIWGKFFPRIIFYGPQREQPWLNVAMRHHVNFFVTDAAGFVAHKALRHAIDNYPGFDGYIFTHDDVVMNLDSLSQHPADEAWLISSENSLYMPDVLKEEPGGNDWFNMEFVGKTSIKKIVTDPDWQWNNEIEQCTGSPGKFTWGYSDMFYIPQKYAKEYARVMKVIEKTDLFLEFAVPTTLKCIMKAKSKLTVHTPWDERRNNLEFYKTDSQFQSNLTYDIIHPLKLTSPGTANWIQSFFCRNNERMTSPKLMA